MYKKGRQHLQQLDDALQTLREEARGGYAKDDIRRNYLKAELTAQREARERRAAQQQNNTKASTSAGSMGNAPAPWMEGTITMTTLLDSNDDTDDRGGEEADGVLQCALGQMREVYHNLVEAVSDYAYDTALQERLGTVREVDDATGLPTEWVAMTGPPMAVDRDGFFPLNVDLQAVTDRQPSPPPSQAGIAARETPWRASPQSPGRLLHEPVTPAGASRRKEAPSTQQPWSGAIPRRQQQRNNSLLSTSSGGALSLTTSTRKLHGGKKDTHQQQQQPLSSHGSAVAVNYASGFAQTLAQQAAAARRQRDGAPSPQPLSLSQHGNRAGADGTAEQPIRCFTPHSVYTEEAAMVLTRVVRQSTLLFCSSCQYCYTFEAAAGSEKEDTVVTCPRCNAHIHLADVLPPRQSTAAAEEEVNMDGSSTSKVRGVRFQCPSKARATTVTMGTDCVGFPGEEDGKHAVAAGASWYCAAATGTTDTAVVMAHQQQPLVTPPWDTAVNGVYFLYLYDEANRTSTS